MEFIKQKQEWNPYRKLQIHAIFLGNRDLFDLSYRQRLSFFEKIWAFELLLLVTLTKKNKPFSRLALPYLRRRVEMHSFKALTRTCDENRYRRLVEVFDAMNAGILA